MPISTLGNIEIGFLRCRREAEICCGSGRFRIFSILTYSWLRVEMVGLHYESDLVGRCLQRLRYLPQWLGLAVISPCWWSRERKSEMGRQAFVQSLSVDSGALRDIAVWGRWLQSMTVLWLRGFMSSISLTLSALWTCTS